MLVAGGIIVGIFLIFVEIAYKNRKDKKVREHELSRKAFATWKKNVEVMHFKMFSFIKSK
jgi:glutamate receptor ionotropic, NMDA 1